MQNTIDTFLEHHRFYSNRSWQYFGAVLLINSLILNVLKDLKDESYLIAILSFISIALIAVFYHLLNWTDMRIDMNMQRVNEMLEKKVPVPNTFLENSINWSKFAIIVLTLPYYFITQKYCQSMTLTLGLAIFFLAIILLSGRTRRKFEQKNK